MATTNSASDEVKMESLNTNPTIIPLRSVSEISASIISQFSSTLLTGMKLDPASKEKLQDKLSKDPVIPMLVAARLEEAKKSFSIINASFGRPVSVVSTSTATIQRVSTISSSATGTLISSPKTFAYTAAPSKKEAPKRQPLQTITNTVNSNVQMSPPPAPKKIQLSAQQLISSQSLQTVPKVPGKSNPFSPEKAFVKIRDNILEFLKDENTDLCKLRELTESYRSYLKESVYPTHSKRSSKWNPEENNYTAPKLYTNESSIDVVKLKRRKKKDDSPAGKRMKKTDSGIDLISQENILTIRLNPYKL